ncbi:condensation domain-containing protein [Streptomyces fuscichromogenes]|uniref:condensation domain-containing protein n=1 Tax=Streptomyces fuscichromogenes TaxID=1324013 RepID=UPI0037FBA899
MSARAARLPGGRTAGIAHHESLVEAPVSEQQRAMWFLERTGRPGTYNIGSTVRIRGELDVPALRRALAEVVDRHRILRSVLTETESEGDVRQRVRRLDEIELFDENWDGRAEAPFDLGTGPLVRARIDRQGPDDHLFSLCFHHAVYDGGSAPVFWRELWRAYRGERLDEPAVQYADYAIWQQRRLAGGVLDQQAQWWADTLKGCPVLTTLPADRPRPAHPTGAGHELRLRMPEPVRRGVDALAETEGASFYMVVLAALQAFVSRVAGQDDVVIGSPLSGRVRPELREVIGCFVNTVATRADLSDDPSFRTHLSRTRDQVLDLFDHLELPFDRVVETVNPPRSPSWSPLFQMLYVHQGDITERDTPPELHVTEVDERTDSAKFDWLVTTWQDADGMVLSIEYATELFDDGTVRRLADEFLGMLAAAVADPEAALGDHPLTASAGLVGSATAAPGAADAPGAAELAAEKPVTPTERYLAGLWQQLLDVPRVRRNDDFFLLGGHSFLGIRLLNRVRLQYGVDLPAAALFEARTLYRLGRVIDRALTAPAAPELLPMAEGTGPAFFLVHPVGGGVGCYAALARHLGCPVYALEAVGLGTVEEMAEAYLAAVESTALPPLALGGWSMGGVVAFEMARRLELRTGRALPVLMIDSHVPEPDTEPPTEADLVSWFAADWGAAVGTDLGPSLTTREQLWQRARERGLLEPPADAGLVERLLDRFETNLHALRDFTVTGPYPGRVCLIRADDEPGDRDDHGWGAVTTRPVRTIALRGDHYGVMRGPELAPTLARLLQEAIDHG